MRLSFFQICVLVLICATYNTFTYADKSVKETSWDHDSIRTAFRGERVYRRLHDDKAITPSADKTNNGEDEERSLTFRGLSKLKTSFQGNTKSAAVLQKNPTFIKEIENLKSNPVVAKELNQNPVLIKKLKSLEKNPAVLESLRTAPVGKSMKRMQTYLSNEQARHKADEQLLTYALSFMIIFSGFIGIVGLLTTPPGPA